MTQEEKAKAYDKALNWMRELYPGLHGATKEDAEHYFPELREDESEDERIRRTLVEYFGPKVQLDFVRGIPIQKIRDWLEKQKEQKPLETPSPSVIYTEQGEVLAEQKPAEWGEDIIPKAVKEVGLTQHQIEKNVTRD